MFILSADFLNLKRDALPQSIARIIEYIIVFAIYYLKQYTKCIFPEGIVKILLKTWVDSGNRKLSKPDVASFALPHRVFGYSPINLLKNAFVSGFCGFVKIC